LESENAVNIGIKNNQRKQRLATAVIGRKLESLLRSLGRPDAEVSILFVGDTAMRSLNRRYRQKDATTDVLSFSFREGDHPHIQPHFLGDIVISVPVAVRQARAAGHPVAREIEILLVHGLLHLLGYDHERGPREARRMRLRELQLLKRLSA
jgi:rRNA maturation RNase YbeY